MSCSASQDFTYLLIFFVSSPKVSCDFFMTQADLMQCIKDILFPAAMESIFGAAFLQHHSTARLQQAFFKFEEGFELAASPMPHLLQPSFCQGKRTLLEALRCCPSWWHSCHTTSPLHYCLRQSIRQAKKTLLEAFKYLLQLIFVTIIIHFVLSRTLHCNA